MKTYYITFFTAQTYCLTFKGTTEELYSILQTNRDFLLELWQKPEAEAMFYKEPEKRYLWLMDNRADFNDILGNIGTHGTSKPANTISILERI